MVIVAQSTKLPQVTESRLALASTTAEVYYGLRIFKTDGYKWVRTLKS